MTHERFLQILQAYGADPAHWPQAERAEAQAYAAAHPDAIAEARRAEAALDAMLDGLEDAVPSDLLERRIMKRFPQPVAAAPRWQVPVAAAAALLVGAFIGFASGALTVTESVETTLYADAYAGLDEDWVTWLGEDV